MKCPICSMAGRMYMAGTLTPDQFFNGNNSYAIAEGLSSGRLPVWTCRTCGHGYEPLGSVTAGDIVKWYERNEPDEAFLADEAVRRKTARAVLRRIQTHAGRGKLLDVGAGPGIFISEAKRLSWDVLGLEPSKWASDYARREFGVPMKQADFSALRELPEHSFAVVTIFDVIEHVVNPRELLEDIYRVLQPGGLLVLTTPKFDSFFARLWGRKWHAIFPAHLHYFTTKSLYQILKDAGFTVRRNRPHTRYLGAYYFWRRLLAYFGFAKMKPITKASAAIPINVGDEFEIYASK